MKKLGLLILTPSLLLFSLSCISLSTPISATPEQIATQSQPFILSTPLAGLVYSVYNEENNDTAVWQIDGDGKSKLLLPNHYFGMLSSDKNQFVYYDNFWNSSSPCTWLLDFRLNKTQSLDCSTGEGSLPADILGWPPNKPNTLIAILNQSGGEMGGAWGVLGTISLENGDKEILDSIHSIQSVEISPSGNMIAYGSNDFQTSKSSGWLYSWDSGVISFTPQDYGVNYPQISNPVWSPDGTKIVWGLMDDEFNSAIGVFELDKKTAKVLHPFKQEIMPDLRPSPPSSFLSPDGQFLAVHAVSKNQSEWWIIRMDDGTEYKINGEFNSWSPDGQWLLYTTYPELYIVRSGESEIKKLGEIDNYGYSRTVLWDKDGRYLVFVNNDKKISYVNIGTWEVNKVTGIEEVSNLIDWVAPISTFFKVESLP